MGLGHEHGKTGWVFKWGRQPGCDLVGLDKREGKVTGALTQLNNTVQSDGKERPWESDDQMEGFKLILTGLRASCIPK